MKLNILTILLFLFFGSSYAHEQKIVQKKHKNVEVVIYTEDYTEVINSALMVAKSTSNLLKNLKYKGKIKLFFIEEHYKEGLVFSYTDKKELNIRFMLTSFNISKCLNVINYSIKNKGNLSPDKSFFIGLYNSDPNSSSNSFFDRKIYRPDEIKELNKSAYFNYYYQSNKFHFYKLVDNKEVVIADVEALEDFFPVSSDLLFIFTSKDNFSVVNKIDIEKFNIVNNNSRFYTPFTIKPLNNNKLAIVFSPISINRDRVMVYLLDKNILIQDIDNCK